VLSYSRSALLAAVVAIAGWIAFVPLRLRSALMLGLAGVCAAPIVVVALASHNLSADLIAPSAQDAAGHAFGPVLLGLVVLAAAVGVAASVAMNRVAVGEQVRRHIGTVLLVGVALIPVAVVVALAASSRGLFGEISHAWESLTSSKSVVHDTASRLTQLGSARPIYWQQGLDVGAHALLKGAGELGYGIARLRYTTSQFKTDEAHSYLVQTFADLGLVGLALTGALLLAWARAASRSLVPATRWRSLSTAQAAERQGLIALGLVVVVFGIQSCLDFTFYFAGLAVPALLCAGWLAGRGPLSAPVGRRTGARVGLMDRPGAGATITALAAVALIGGWLMWQPLRSAQAMGDAENHPDRAFASAHIAASRDPLALEPLYLLSELYQAANDTRGARAQLAKATQVQPDNPRPWVLLGLLDFHSGRRSDAINEMKRVLALEHPSDTNTLNADTVISQSEAQLAQQRAERRSRARANALKRRRSRAARRAGHRAARPHTPR
jgi:O-antigen ligase/polysaccharide polymerase Wzy-like membrane protein